MKKLYLTLLEIIKEIPTIRWADLNTGQLQTEMPPVAFPAVLISLGNFKCEALCDTTQRVYASFTLTLVGQPFGETNSHATDTMRSDALQYLDLAEEIYRKMQGFESEAFYPFNRTGVQFKTLKGLSVVDLDFETAFEDDTANS